VVPDPITAHRRSRPILFAAIAAAIVVAIVAAGFALWPRDERFAHVIAPATSDAPTSLPTTTAPATTSSTPPTTTPATCPQGDASIAPRSGAGPGAPAVISNVMVEAGTCEDVIVFTMRTGDGWRASYESGSVIGADGLPLVVSGSSHLVVRFDQPVEDDGWMYGHSISDALTPVAPSVVRAVRLVVDSEGNGSIVIGLDGDRPFAIDASDEAWARSHSDSRFIPNAFSSASTRQRAFA